MKMIKSNRAAAALILAAASVVSGQEKPADSAPQTNAVAKSESFLRFEGTDLHIGKLPPITFHGFASQGFLASTDYNYLGDSTDGSFEFTEIGINASFSPFKRTRITAQVFDFDLGDVNNFKPFLDYASVEYTLNDYVGVRGGRVRRPGGIYNHIQDVDLARTSVLLPQGMYDARWRDFSTSIDGGVVFGNISMKKAGSLSYEGFAGVMNLSADGGIARIIENGLRSKGGGELDSFTSPVIVGGQLWWNTPVAGLRAGAMFANVFDFGYDISIDHPQVGLISVEDRSAIFAHMYSVEYLWKSWTFQAEYFNFELDGTTTQENAALGTSKSPSASHSDTWYFGAAYRFNKWIEAGAYYTEYYGNIDDRSGSKLPVGSDGFQKDVALSLRFDPKDWWILKLEGHYIRGTGLLSDDAANPTRNDDGWWMFAAKTTFSF
ncbi:MAG TPA: hypothetical protein VK530_10890 [Candidatus Acidoferrum sp.]|nr:hypothetical protein [Candidatus Acidoferrum sp.]